MPVCDLLRFGLRDDCSGTIDLWRPSEERGLMECGRIVFSNGWVLEACSPQIGDGRNRDEVTAALAELLRWRGGHFEITLSCRETAHEMTLELGFSRLVRDAIAREEGVKFGARETWL